MAPFDHYGRSVSEDAGDSEGKLAAGGGAVGPVHVIRKGFIAADQDTTLFPAATGAPRKFRLLDVFIDVDTTNAAETLTLRTAAAGGGSALSAALSLAAAGRIREATAPALRLGAAGTNVFLRRNTTVGVGDLVAFIQYEQ